jgi:Plasmid pRiA4b ORF-3-like protein
MPLKKQTQNGKQGSHKPKQVAKKPSRTDKSDLLFQFKITLLEIKPPIWRRVQIPDCTLAVLHELIQAAMGWENCHLHRFIIKDVGYGEPDPDLGLKDEAKVLLSKIIPKSGNRFRFRYEYDFGDSWIHDIVFESHSPNDLGQNYPLCLVGSRACPPEDCGGPWNYEDFLEAIADPKHERHVEVMDWLGGRFDPEEFNSKTATKAMMKAVRRSP